MKIERINENQIKCTLSNFDLISRNLNISKLAYGSEEAKNLFFEMLQKASKEVGFETNGAPIMVEATPMENESMMLVITKVDDPEELDTRFAKFAPMSDNDNGDALTIPKLLEGATEILGLINERLKQSKAESEKEEIPYEIRIFEFNSLDLAITAAKASPIGFTGCNALYKNTDNNKYVLCIDNNNVDFNIFANTINILNEYGKSISSHYTSKAYLDEHFDIIIKDDAISKLSNI